MAAQAIPSTIIYSIKAEDLIAFNRIYYPKGSPIPEAIEAIKNLVHTKHVWLDQPILHRIAKKDYELTEVLDEHLTPSDNWQITLLGEILLIKQDGVISVNRAHLVHQTVHSVDEDLDDELNLGMDLAQLKQRFQLDMLDESKKNAPVSSVVAKDTIDNGKCVIQ